MALNARTSSWLIFMLGASALLGCGSDEGGSPVSGGSGGAGGTAGSSGTSASQTGGATSASQTGGATSASQTGGATTGGSGSTSVDGTCTTASECGGSAICDPADGKCKPFQCDDERACESGKTCIWQSDTATGGVCQDDCVPFESACSGDRECVSLVLDDSLGVCVPRGTSAAGAACEDSAVSTGCADGLVCVSGECRDACPYFGSADVCPEDQRCNPFGICVDVKAGSQDPECRNEGDFCGDDGERLRGYCVTLPGSDTPSCASFCLTTEPTCASATEQCLSVASGLPELGICVDLSECLDGGEEHESCDQCLSAEVQASTGCCSAVAEACETDLDCADFISCLGSCAEDDEACVEACVDESPEGVDLYLQTITCVYGTPDGDPGACSAACASE